MHSILEVRAWARLSKSLIYNLTLGFVLLLIMAVMCMDIYQTFKLHSAFVPVHTYLSLALICGHKLSTPFFVVPLYWLT